MSNSLDGLTFEEIRELAENNFKPKEEKEKNESSPYYPCVEIVGKYMNSLKDIPIFNRLVYVIS